MKIITGEKVYIKPIHLLLDHHFLKILYDFDFETVTAFPHPSFPSPSRPASTGALDFNSNPENFPSTFYHVNVNQP